MRKKPSERTFKTGLSLALGLIRHSLTCSAVMEFTEKEGFVGFFMLMAYVCRRATENTIIMAFP